MKAVEADRQLTKEPRNPVAYHLSYIGCPVEVLVVASHSHPAELVLQGRMCLNCVHTVLDTQPSRYLPPLYPGFWRKP